MKSKKRLLREYAEAIITALILALIIRTYVVQAFKIPSGSMIPTLLIGDHILVNKFIYGTKIPFSDNRLLVFKKPQKGDIIVFKYPKNPEKDFIKRVIAVEGDWIEIRKKQVYINNELLERKYAIYSDSHFVRRDNFGPVKVPPNSLFVMGDNRDNSKDSRFWGFVDLKAVKGKAFMIYWSWDKENFGVRWNRIGLLLK